MLPPTSPHILLQLGLVSVVVGDAASFAISHQQFSGDPVSALLVTLQIGMVLGLPGAFFQMQKQNADKLQVQSDQPVNENLRAVAAEAEKTETTGAGL